MKRTLVLTKLSNKNIDGDQIFFLNENLLNKNNIKYYKNKKYIVCKKYFKFKSKNIILFYKDCEKIYNSIIKDIKINLNNYHSIKFSTRAWKIILGHWLKKFIYIVYDRYHNIEHIIKRNKINRVYFLDSKDFQLATDDTSGISYASVNEEWNNKLYEIILNEFSYINKIKIGRTNKKKLIYQTNLEKDQKVYKSLKFIIINFIFKILNLFFKKSKVTIFKSYLPFLLEKKLELKFSSIPFPYFFENLKMTTYKEDKRKKLDFYKPNCSILEHLVRKIIIKAIPLSIIENFKQYENISDYIFPKKSRFILTANAFDSDELFKIYSAKSVDKKIKYFVLQHGGTYFSNIDSNYRVEYQTSDKFFSWGYKGKKIVPYFNINTIKRIKNNLEKKILTTVFHSAGWEVYPYRDIENKIEIEDTFNILNLLEPEIKKKTLIRFHHSHKYRYKFLTKKFLEKDFYKLDYGKLKISDLDKITKLYFFNYDSTGLLENLALNIPTVCFFSNKFESINKNFFNKYKYLIKANILFTDKKKIFSHIQNNWNSINDWWLSKQTQNYIKQFNKNFNVKYNKNSLNKFKAIINREIN